MGRPHENYRQRTSIMFAVINLYLTFSSVVSRQHDAETIDALRASVCFASLWWCGMVPVAEVLLSVGAIGGSLVIYFRFMDKSLDKALDRIFASWHVDAEDID